MQWNLTDDDSTMVQVMTFRQQAITQAALLEPTLTYINVRQGQNELQKLTMMRDYCF